MTGLGLGAAWRGPGTPAEPTGRTLVMGVVNVTPDSFSDGGRFLEAERAVTHGLRLRADGADLVDVGGESTRPGAARPDVAEELRRVLPVVRDLAAAGVPVSVDTMRAQVAAAALEAGATLVNDVSGGKADPDILRVVAEAGTPYVLMHWRAPSAVMQQHTRYDDVVADVRDELAAQLDVALAAGVRVEQVVLDPGLGFAKDPEQNWTLLAGLETLADLGRPLLVATSRKRFLGELLGGREPAGRDAATTATTALLAEAGVWAVRVHDVAAAADAVRVVARWQQARQQARQEASP